MNPSVRSVTSFTQTPLSQLLFPGALALAIALSVPLRPAAAQTEVDAGPFLAQVTQVTTSQMQATHLVRIEVRFRNLTDKPLILAYRKNSGTMTDEHGARYAVDSRYANRVVGIGQADAGTADPQFVLGPGRSSTATFEFSRYLGKTAVGAAYSAILAVQQLEVASARQTRLIREHSLNFGGLKPGVVAAHATSPASATAPAVGSGSGPTAGDAGAAVAGAVGEIAAAAARDAALAAAAQARVPKRLQALRDALTNPRPEAAPAPQPVPPSAEPPIAAASQPTGATAAPATGLAAIPGPWSAPATAAAIAATAGFVDIVGLKPGMTVAQAMEALKAHNPNFALQPFTVRLEGFGNQELMPVLHASWDSTVRNRPTSERIKLGFTTPPTKEVLLGVDRTISFAADELPAIENVLTGLRNKYGPEFRISSVGGHEYFWFFDIKGNRIVDRAKAESLARRCISHYPFDGFGPGAGPYSQAIPDDDASTHGGECWKIVYVKASISEATLLDGRPAPRGLASSVGVRVDNRALYRASVEATRAVALAARAAQESKDRRAAEQRTPKF